MAIYQTERLEQVESESLKNIQNLNEREKQIERYSAIIDSQNRTLSERILQINSLQQSLVSTNATINKLVQDFESQKTITQAQKDQLESLNSMLVDKDSQLNEIQQRIVSLNAELESNRLKVSELNKQITHNTVGNSRITVSHYGLGVTQDNKGVVFPIEVEILKPGNGIVSLDIGNAQYESSFQTAVRTAASVAAKYSEVSMHDRDIIVRFAPSKSSGIVNVDGPSAGALITSMIVSGLTDRKIDSSVLLTGAIGPDGSVNSIGGLQQKTEAAANFGASKILVPKGQEFKSDRIPVIGVPNIQTILDHLLLRR